MTATENIINEMNGNVSIRKAQLTLSFIARNIADAAYDFANAQFLEMSEEKKIQERIAIDKAAQNVGLFKVLTGIADESIIFEYVYRTQYYGYDDQTLEENKQALQEFNYSFGTFKAFEW